MPWLNRNDDVLATARDRAALAKLAYEGDKRRLGTALGRRFLRLELLPLDLGFVAGNDREVVVAFSGTRDGIDWAFNVVHPLTPGYGGRVHKGFAQLANHVAEEVARAVRESRTLRQRVILTGHSRGGALAALTAQRLLASGVEMENVYTFGAPKFGDATFAQAYRPVLFRCEDVRDPIPRLPPFLDYQSVGKRLIVTGEGKVYQADNSWSDHLLVLGLLMTQPSPEALDCHSIDHYIRQLGN